MRRSKEPLTRAGLTLAVAALGHDAERGLQFGDRLVGLVLCHEDPRPFQGGVLVLGIEFAGTPRCRLNPGHVLP